MPKRKKPITYRLELRYQATREYDYMGFPEINGGAPIVLCADELYAFAGWELPSGDVPFAKKVVVEVTPREDGKYVKAGNSSFEEYGQTGSTFVVLLSPASRVLRSLLALHGVDRFDVSVKKSR